MKSIFTFSLMFAFAVGFAQNKQEPIVFSKNDLTPTEFVAPTFNPEAAKSIEQLTRMGFEAPKRNVERNFGQNKNESDKLNTVQIPLNLFSRGGGAPCNLEEGFEASVPPPGWTLNQFNTAETWYQDAGVISPPSEGLASAICEYDPALNFQLEQLQSGAVNLSTLTNPTLTFDWLSSYYWGVDPNNNYDVNVYISTNSGANWTLLWNEDGEGVFTSFQWYTEVIDLSAYGTSTNALFRFEYFGLDGAQANLDAISVCGIIPGAPCTAAASTYNDLNTAGGAPCFDGVQCVTTDPAFAGLGIYGSEAYLLDNVEAGFDYVFDMCSGFGAGSWVPEIVILAADGTTIDAENTASGTSGLTHGAQCSLAWTATQSGTYTILINEMGTASGNAPSQANCITTLAVDNGNPTVTCGQNPFPCLPCDVTTLTSPLSQTVCPGDTGVIALTGAQSSPGDFSIGFAEGPGASGGLPGGFTLTGLAAIDFPYGFDNDLNGVLSFNALDTLLGTWFLTTYATQPNGANCDSTAVTTVNFLTATDPLCTSGPCTDAADTWNDLETNGGAPCFDGVNCWTTDAGFNGIGIYGSEAYTLSGVMAGFDYVFDMCTGFGAGSWVPEIVILAADGTTIDADNIASGASGLTHGQQCSLAWTASQSGTYTIIINQMGTAFGDAPNQVDCLTSYAVDNGNPTVTCGQNPAPCPPCEAGMITTPTTQGVCPGQTLDIALTGNNSPDTYNVGFAPGSGASGGNPAGFSVTGYVALDFPLSLDNDLNGILSANLVDTLLGTWTITVYAVNSGFICDSTTNTITVTFYSANDPACITGIGSDEEINFELYPNPNQGLFTVGAQNISGATTINVMDMSGKLILTETMYVNNGFRKSYDLNVAAGTYVVQLLTNENLFTRKLTVE